MKLSRRMFNQGAGATVAAATILSFRSADLALAEPASDAPEPVVLARATSVVLEAGETHVVLAPVPPPRRPQPKARPKTKGAKPAPPRMQIVLRDIVSTKGAPAYEVFLVLEGPNVFQATTTRVQIGTLEQSGGSDGGEGDKGNGVKRDIVTFDANEAFASFAKIRGFNIRHLRVVIVRRAVKDEQGKEAGPPDPMPPEIGAIELVRS